MEQNWNQRELNLKGLKILIPFYREDIRGYFLKNFEVAIFEEFSIQGFISESFETYSEKYVVRGLHFQTNEPQAKLVRAVQGEIYDVALDLRRGSKTFGKYEAVYLNASMHEIFYIPAGFAHGFQVVSENALVSYQCIGQYLKEYDTGIYYKDSQVGVLWPYQKCIVSDKDEHLMSFAEFKDKYVGLEVCCNENNR